MQILCFSRPSVLIMKFHEKNKLQNSRTLSSYDLKLWSGSECPKINRHAKDKHRDMEGQ